MKNITVSISDEVYRAARIRAAERGTSVSAMVAEHLISLSSESSAFARLEARQHAIQREITRFRAGDRVGRDEVHAREVR